MFFPFWGLLSHPPFFLSPILLFLGNKIPQSHKIRARSNLKGHLAPNLNWWRGHKKLRDLFKVPCLLWQTQTHSSPTAVQPSCLSETSSAKVSEPVPSAVPKQWSLVLCPCPPLASPLDGSRPGLLALHCLHWHTWDQTAGHSSPLPYHDVCLPFTCFIHLILPSYPVLSFQS